MQKKYYTLEEAAAFATDRTGQSTSEINLLEAALEDHIQLSIRFRYPAKGYRAIREKNTPETKYTFAKDAEQLPGICDLVNGDWGNPLILQEIKLRTDNGPDIHGSCDIHLVDPLNRGLFRLQSIVQPHEQKTQSIAIGATIQLRKQTVDQSLPPGSMIVIKSENLLKAYPPSKEPQKRRFDSIGAEIEKICSALERSGQPVAVSTVWQNLEELVSPEHPCCINIELGDEGPVIIYAQQGRTKRLTQNMLSNRLSRRRKK